MGGPSDTWSDSDETDGGTPGARASGDSTSEATLGSTIEIGGPVAVEPTPEDAPRYGPPRLLGEGGIGSVSALHDSRLGREVARKQLKPGATHRTLRRFLREARVTAQLEHPGIVPVHDAGVDAEGRHFYTMKYVRGRSLGEALAAATGLQERLRWVDSFTDAVQAMAYAHSRSVIHRDLKPDNIMVGEFGETLVVDWGLARALDDLDERDPTDDSGTSQDRPLDLGDSAQTVHGGISGTPSYMAPEQARGGKLSPAADVFGLGAILYEILTGAPPYGRGPALEILALAAKGDWKRVRDVQPDSPPELAAIAEKALQPDPAGRYATAAGMASDLVAWQQGRRVSAHAYSSRELLQRFVTAYRAPLGVLGLGLALTVGTGFVGWYSTVRQRDAAEQARTDAERALAASYAARAASAEQKGYPLEAQLFAAAALEIRDDASSWGVLARFRDVPLLRLEWESEVVCTNLRGLPDGYLCGGDGQITRVGPRGEVRWRVARTARITDVGEHSFLVGVADAEGGTVAELSLDDGRELRVLPGIATAAFSGDGALWGASRGVLRVLRPSGESLEEEGSGSLMARFREHGGAMYGLTVSGNLYRFAPDGTHTTLRAPRVQSFDFAFAGDLPVVVGDFIEVLSSDGGQVVHRISSEQTTTSIETRGPMAAILDVGGGLVLANARDGVVHTRFRTHDGPGGLAFPEPDHLVIGDADALRGWRVTEGDSDFIDVGARTKVLSVDPRGERAVICGHHGFLGVIELDPFALLWSEQPSGGQDYDHCGWVDDGRVFALPERETPSIRDSRTGSPVANARPGLRPGLALTAPGGWVLRPEGTRWTLENAVDDRTLGGDGLRGVGRRDDGLWVQDDDGLHEIGLAEGKLGPVLLPPRDDAYFAYAEHGFVAGRGNLVSYESRDGSVRCDLGTSVGAPLFHGDHVLVPRASGEIAAVRVTGPQPDCAVVVELRGHNRRIASMEAVGDRIYSFGWDGHVRRWDLSVLDRDPSMIAAEIRERAGFGLVDGEVVRTPQP